MAAKRTKLNPKDGEKRDFVWKTSDTKKNRKGQKVAIVLLPTRFKKPHRFKSVTLYNVNGEVLSKLKWVYYYDEDGSHRQVWRTELAMKDLPKLCSLVAVGPNKREYVWPLADPSQRID